MLSRVRPDFELQNDFLFPSLLGRLTLWEQHEWETAWPAYWLSRTNFPSAGWRRRHGQLCPTYLAHAWFPLCGIIILHYMIQLNGSVGRESEIQVSLLKSKFPIREMQVTTVLHAETVVNFQLLLLTRKQMKIFENAMNELFTPENSGMSMSSRYNQFSLRTSATTAHCNVWTRTFNLLKLRGQLSKTK